MVIVVSFGTIELECLQLVHNKLFNAKSLKGVMKSADSIDEHQQSQPPTAWKNAVFRRRPEEKCNWSLMNRP